jgi:predicted outer membrane lipoprotein
MSERHRSIDGLLILVVLAHLAVTVLHGRAHTGAEVPVSAVASLFIFSVIVVAPVVGAVMLWFFSIEGGAWLLALSLAASLIFGVVNHFILESPDHVARIASEWKGLFTVTAVLLALTEALGSGLAFWRAAHVRAR